MSVQPKQDGLKVVTGEGRLSFVHVYEPYAHDDKQDPKYSVRLLIPKVGGEATIKALEAAIKEAIEVGKKKLWQGEVPEELDLPIRDGDTPKIVKKYPEHAGHWYINASSDPSRKKPEVVDRGRFQILDPNDLYSGCYGRISVGLYPFRNSGNDGVGIGLNNVQKLREGERLAGGTTADEDFGDDLGDSNGLMD